MKDLESYPLSLDPELSALKAFDSFLERIDQRFQFSDDLNNALKLCGHEVITNIISYGFDDVRSPSPIQVLIQVGEREVALEIVDQGIDYNPLEQTAPEPADSAEDAQIGGLGVMLVKAFADKVSYCRQNNENRLTMEFNR